MLSVRSADQLMNSHIHSKNRTRSPGWRIRNLYPKNYVRLCKAAPLNQTRTRFRQPLVQHRGPSTRKPYTASFFQSGKLDHQVKAASAVLYRDELRVQNGATAKHGNRSWFAEYLRGSFRCHYKLQRLLQCLGFVPFRQACIRKSRVRRFVESAGSRPQRPGVEIHRCPVRLQERSYSSPFLFCYELQVDFYCSTHASLISLALRVPRRNPYRRQQKEVITATRSFNKSSCSSASRFITIRSQPSFGRRISKKLKPKRVSRSLCSTTSRQGESCCSNSLSFFRLSFMPEPTSLITRYTSHPRARQNSKHRSACRSRSSFFSCEETRQYTTVGRFSRAGDVSTRMAPLGVLYARTGSLPRLNHRQAVMYAIPCCLAQSASFMSIF